MAAASDVAAARCEGAPCTHDMGAVPPGIATPAVLGELRSIDSDLRAFLREARGTVCELAAAAEEAVDVAAACCMHAHHVILHTCETASAWTTATASKFLASAAFVFSWHVPSFGSGMRDAEEDMATVGHNEARRHESGETPAVPLAAVFKALAAQSTHVQSVVAHAGAPERAHMLRGIVSAAIDGVDARQPGAPAAVGLRRSRSLSEANNSPTNAWLRVLRPPLCRGEVESVHPYRAEIDTYHTLSFPGAKYVKVCRAWACHA